VLVVAVVLVLMVVVVASSSANENLATAKIVKIEFNANLDLLGFPHFVTFKECRNVP